MNISLENDILMPSDRDIVELSRAVQDRFLDLCNAYLRIRGVQLVPPEGIKSDMLRWRRMVARHSVGNMHHTQSEKLSLRSVAQWTLDTNCRIRNQPTTTIVWKD